MDFEKADKVAHFVENQWHFKLMTKYGFRAIDKTAVGFVRHYNYEHIKTKYRICACTGIHADYFTDITNKTVVDDSYHNGLKLHLKKLKTLDFI